MVLIFDEESDESEKRGWLYGGKLVSHAFIFPSLLTFYGDIFSRRSVGIDAPGQGFFL